jgi:uncharacterized protein (TIGR03067 family)
MEKTYAMAAGLVAVALAAGAAPPTEAAERIAGLIRQLGAEGFKRREAASKELDAIGAPALSALRKAASDDDLEIRRRAERLVQAITARLVGVDQKRLEGTWLGVSQEADGKETPSRHRVVLADGRSVATDPAGGEVFRCTWRVIDPTATPRQLDLVAPDGRVFQAIYEFDGTRLRYCGSYTGRPDHFSTTPGDGRYMATLKREPK